MRRIDRMAGLLCIAAFFAAAAPARPQAPAAAGGRSLDVFWTDTPPALDGKADDPCWKDAALAPEFVLLGGRGRPKNPSDVRAVYDARALYLFWNLHDINMAAVKTGVPEPPGGGTMRAQIDYPNTDLVELFLAPGRSLTTYYQLMASPLGTRYDSFIRPGGMHIRDFTPDWQVVSGRIPGGWTLEMRIPFAELAHPGMLAGTPAVGARWGANFCRNRVADWAEWTQWSPTERGFHDPKNFGTLTFRGRKGGAPTPSVAAAAAGPLSFGPGEIVLSVAGTDAPSAVCESFLDGKPAGRCAAAVSGGAVRIPYRFTQAGRHRLAVTLSAGGAVFYTGQALAALTTGTQDALRRMDAGISEGYALLKRRRGAHPALAGLAAELAAFDAKSRGARAKLARLDGLSADEWKALDAEAAALAADWARLRFGLNLARLYPGAAGRPVPFAVGDEAGTGKVYRDTVYEGSLSAPVRLSLAGNEYGSFQLAVIPFWRPVAGAEVSFSDLRGPGGRTVPAARYRWSRVGYVKVTQIDPKDLSAFRYEPDPLFPAAPFDVAAGEVGAVWVDLLLPAGTPAGTYRGTVAVSAGGYRAERPVEVSAYGFDIPERSSLETDWWFAVYPWRRFYGTPFAYTPELHARHAAVLGRYRIGSFPNDWTAICEHVKIYREPDGRFTFDWTVFDKFIRNGLDNRATAFWSALSCNSGWTAWLNNPGVAVIERASGARKTLKDYYPAENPDWRGNAAYYKNNPLYRAFLPAYAAHLKELGIDKYSYYELFDEAHRPDDWLKMIEHLTFIRELAPGIQFCNYGYSPTDFIAGKTAHGLIDAWAPHLTRIEQDGGKVLEAIHERRAKYGEKFWAYTCGEGEDADGNYNPYMRYDRPYMALRMHGWFAWKYRLDGYLLFMLSGIDEANVKKDPKERWPNGDWEWASSGWCGTMVYPGPEQEMIPGIRLANAREGLEDLEYFHVLEKEAKNLDPAKHAALAARVKAALEIEPAIISTVYVWTKDRTLLEAKRGRLAALIAEVRRAGGRSR